MQLPKVDLNNKLREQHLVPELISVVKMCRLNYYYYYYSTGLSSQDLLKSDFS